MRRRAQRQRLDQRDAQCGPRLGVIGQGLPGRRIDQRVEIGEPAQRFGGDGVRQRPIVAALDPPGRRIERRFDRLPAPQHGIEHTHRRAACRYAGAIRLRRIAP